MTIVGWVWKCGNWKRFYRLLFYGSAIEKIIPFRFAEIEEWETISLKLNGLKILIL